MSTQNLKEKVLHSLTDKTLVETEPAFQDIHIQTVLDQLDSELVQLKLFKTKDLMTSSTSLVCKQSIPNCLVA